MSVEELINQLTMVENKTIEVELYDYNGDRYEISSVDIFYDDEGETNVDINFSSKQKYSD